MSIHTAVELPAVRLAHRSRLEAVHAMCKSRGVPQDSAWCIVADNLGNNAEWSRASVVADDWSKRTEQKRMGLILSGSSGAGKSVAAARVVMFAEFLQWGELDRHATHFSQYEITPGAMFVSAESLQEALASRSVGRAPDWLARAESCPILAIDELGRESVNRSGQFSLLLPCFISRRFDNRQRTIVTTNMSLEEVSSTYKRAFIDRFISFGSVAKFKESDVVRTRA